LIAAFFLPPCNLNSIVFIQSCVFIFSNNPADFQIMKTILFADEYLIKYALLDYCRFHVLKI